jgi:hypothetical protein
VDAAVTTARLERAGVITRSLVHLRSQRPRLPYQRFSCSNAAKNLAFPEKRQIPDCLSSFFLKNSSAAFHAV